MTGAEVREAGLQAFSSKLRRRKQKRCFWDRFKGSIKVNNEAKDAYNNPTVSLSGNPIEVTDELYAQGIGDAMQIPMKLEYTKNPVMGDAALKGNEETGGFVWTYVFYNQLRHGITLRKGRQQEIRERIFNAAETEMDSEAIYHAKIENWMVSASLYEGISENISASASLDGLEIPKRFHPNAMWWGGASQAAGALTLISGTEGIFPTATHMSAAQVQATLLIMSSYTLDALWMECDARNIEPIVFNGGFAFRLCVIHPFQLVQLKQDARYYQSMDAAYMGRVLQENPLLNGSAGIYGGFVIMTDATAVRGWDDVTGDFLGGGTYAYTSVSKSNPRFMTQKWATVANKRNYCGMVLGASAIGCALADALHFEADDDDYKNVKGLASITDYGYGRMDYVPPTQLSNLLTVNHTTTSTVTGVINESSMIFMTLAH